MKMISKFWMQILRLIGHQEYIRYGIRYRIIGLFYPPYSDRSIPFEVDFFGSIYKGNLNCFLEWNVYFFGAYEKFELFMLRNFIAKTNNPIFIDIGANIGHHSLFMSNFCSLVHAYEPYEAVSKQLEDKISYNNIKKIQLHKVGLGQKDCELDFYAPKGSNTGTGSFVAMHDTQNNQLFGKLQIVNGDHHISSLNLNHIDLIKIDVEGFEKDVLIGLEKTLQKFRPIIFMEFSLDTQLSFKNEEDMMSIFPDGYIVKLIQTNRPFAVFFNVPNYSLEHFDFNKLGSNIVLLPTEIAQKLGLNI